MKQKIIIFTLSALVPMVSFATRVAVTDSGTDFSHEWLSGRVLINEKEIAGNRVDDDRNGKVDDIVGWNFVDDYSRVFFPEHLQSVDEKTFTYFELIARIQAGHATDEDKKFWDENVRNLSAEKKQELLAQLNFYGQYAHSTHVSGIIASLSPDSKIMSNRVFADTPPETQGMMLAKPAKEKSGIADIFYKIIAAISNGAFAQVGIYLNERKIDVANYSLGVSLQTIAKLALGVKGVKTPTPQQLAEETRKVAAKYEPEGRKWMTSSPGTLFVIAAGNDGSDNDALPVFPANVRIANAITVAATNGNAKLADFSNYGAQSVDIAAPGVAIRSSVPSLNHKTLLPMSGTSMASPYIAGVASKAKEINPKMSSTDLRLLLMGTVDKKDWLKGKVISAGVVNPERVYFAAEKAMTMPLAEAIKASLLAVKDLPEAEAPLRMSFENVPVEMKQFAKQMVF